MMGRNATGAGAGAVAAEDAGPGSSWVPGPRVRREALGLGLLDGLRFSVKDLIDIEGAVTGGGNPTWAATHGPAERDAWAVRRLREAGASVEGKTITDELAFSLEGENAHHGTPSNPRAPDRLPGGSSSGSASSVAAGLVDFALGTDTGGSVRVPASFCGLFGFRPSHGAVSLDGVLPFAPSLDTVGWMARDAATLARVGEVLLPQPHLQPRSQAEEWTLLLARDVFALAEPAASAQLRPLAGSLGARIEVDVFDEDPLDWLSAYATVQGAEIRRELGAWLDAHHDAFGPEIAPRFESTRTISSAEIERSIRFRERHAARLRIMLPPGTALVMPTTPGPALRRSVPPAERAEERGAFYRIALPMGALAGLAGLPQVTLPIATDTGRPDGMPLGLSLIAGHGEDRALLALALHLTRRTASSPACRS